MELNVKSFKAKKVVLVKLRVAEVVRRHEGPSPKSLDSDENVKP